MTPTPVLPSLPEPDAHMYPSDLEKFKTRETWAQAFSVAVGNPDERSEPLFTAEQMNEHARRAIESLSRAPAEPVAHICVLPTKDAGPKKFFTAPSDPRGFPVYRHSPGVHPTESAGPATAEMVVPADVMRAAKEFVANGYRGPLAMAKRVFDWVAALGESHEG